MTTCRHNQCTASATAWVEHDEHGEIAVCETHASQFGARQEVLIV